MEQTTLQQRIEQRAADRLKDDLLQAANLEHKIQDIVGKENYSLSIDARDVSWRKFGYEKVELGEKSQEIFNKLLPKYVRMVTDEILNRIDQIEDLLTKKEVEDLPY